MTAPEILTGPSVRFIIGQDGGRWNCTVDAKSMAGPFAGMSGPGSPPEGSPTRAAAIARTAAWVRRFFGPDLHPKQDVWLREISPAQGDLFGAQHP